jgi:uncharacterized protein YqgV (UPF0045/DUF77 family)
MVIMTKNEEKQQQKITTIRTNLGQIFHAVKVFQKNILFKKSINLQLKVYNERGFNGMETHVISVSSGSKGYLA